MPRSPAQKITITAFGSFKMRPYQLALVVSILLSTFLTSSSLGPSIDPNDAFHHSHFGHVGHTHVFAAIRNSLRNGGENSQSYTGPSPNGTYTMEVAFKLLPSVILDDENVLSMSGDGDVILDAAAADPIVQVGSFLFGSHEGAWNSHIKTDNHRRALRGAKKGVTFARCIVGMKKSTDGDKVTLTTEESHPQEAVASSFMKASLNMTRDVLAPHRSRHHNRALGDWCEEACKKADYFQKSDSEVTVNICDR